MLLKHVYMGWKFEHVFQSETLFHLSSNLHNASVLFLNEIHPVIIILKKSIKSGKYLTSFRFSETFYTNLFLKIVSHEILFHLWQSLLDVIVSKKFLSKTCKVFSYNVDINRAVKAKVKYQTSLEKAYFAFESNISYIGSMHSMIGFK